MNKQNESSNRLIDKAILQTIVLQDQQVQLYVPDGKAVQEAYIRKEISFPYWSKVWPSSIALSEFLLLHPDYVQGKKVLELGAGLGLPSLVAARFASAVLCTDHAPEAVLFAQKSAAYHNLRDFHSSLFDWNHPDDRLETDIVLLSDINYEPEAFNALLNIIQNFLQQEKIILLSTPQRLMAKSFIAPLLPFCKQQEEMIIEHHGAPVPISVLVLRT